MQLFNPKPWFVCYRVESYKLVNTVSDRDNQFANIVYYVHATMSGSGEKCTRNGAENARATMSIEDHNRQQSQQQ